MTLSSSSLFHPHLIFVFNQPPRGRVNGAAGSEQPLAILAPFFAIYRRRARVYDLKTVHRKQVCQAYQIRGGYMDLNVYEVTIEKMPGKM